MSVANLVRCGRLCQSGEWFLQGLGFRVVRVEVVWVLVVVVPMIVMFALLLREC